MLEQYPRLIPEADASEEDEEGTLSRLSEDSNSYTPSGLIKQLAQKPRESGRFDVTDQCEAFELATDGQSNEECKLDIRHTNTAPLDNPLLRQDLSL